MGYIEDEIARLMQKCISCGKCVSQCPTAAITLHAGKYVLIGSADAADKKSDARAISPGVRIAVSVLMAALLLAILILTNLPADQTTPEEIPNRARWTSCIPKSCARRHPCWASPS